MFNNVALLHHFTALLRTGNYPFAQSACAMGSDEFGFFVCSYTHFLYNNALTLLCLNSFCIFICAFNLQSLEILFFEQSPYFHTYYITAMFFCCYRNGSQRKEPKRRIMEMTGERMNECRYRDYCDIQSYLGKTSPSMSWSTDLRK